MDGAANPPAPLPDYTIYDPIDPFENHAGPFHWRQQADGSHVFAMRASERHCNSHGIVHGGLLMTMADLTLCANAKDGTPGNYVITVSMSHEFVSGARAGDLIQCRAEVVRRGGSLVFVRGQTRVEDRPVLNFSAVVKRMRPESA